VVESSVHRFVAQSPALNEAPDVGSLVQVHDSGLVVYGVVAGAETTSIDPGRRPYVRDGSAGDADAYLRENPHLAHLYRTLFQVIVVGHEEDARLWHYLPPKPVRLYSAVVACSDDEACRLVGQSPWTRLDLLPLLLGGGDEFIDDVLGAFIRRTAKATGNEREFLRAAGRELAVLLANDPVRLNGVLRRIGH
jgi:hypothetical protein